MKHFAITLLLLTILASAVGQTNVQIPAVVQPSPQAQEFMKYIDYPVDLTAGLPEINIPVYTIVSKELTLPISISYHASGFKPNDKSSMVGQGWTLQAGGRISRTINNAPDEKILSYVIKDESAFPRRCDTYVNGSCQDIVDDDEAYMLWYEAGSGSINNRFDTQYDMFYYSFPGSNGKFILERNTDFNYQPVILPYKPIVIKPFGTANNYNNKITHFDILDVNGNYYRFGRPLGTTLDMTENSESYDIYGQKTRGSGITSWLLTEIISADKSDTIWFEYVIPSTYNVENNFPSYKTITVSGGSWSYESLTGMTTLTKFAYTQARISKIKFRNGEVRFSYVTNPKTLLDKIEIFAKGATVPFRTVKLDQSPYVANNPHWYKLNAIKFIDNKLNNTQEYSFMYYPTGSAYDNRPFPTMASHTLNGYTSYQTYSIDYWGFYNGAPNSMFLAKANPDDPYSIHPTLKLLFGTANRDPNPEYARVGVLRQIKYPSGGTTDYEYEGNRSSYGVNLGGLRIKKIINGNEIESMSRTYHYTASNSSVGEPVSFMYQHSCFKSSTFFANGTNWGATYVNSASPQIDYNLNAQPVTYYSVTEYYGDEQDNLGRVDYIFDMVSTMSSGDIGQDNFPSFDLYSYFPWYGILSTVYTDYGGYIYYQKKYRYGNVYEKQRAIYDADGTLRKKIESFYTHEIKNNFKGLYARQKFQSNLVKNHYFWKKNYTIEQLSQRLDSVKITEYPNNSAEPIVNTTSYTYNDNNFIKEKITKKSNREKIKTAYTYPSEETCGSCSSMVTNNIITPVINKKEFLKKGGNEQLLNNLYTDYDQYGKPLLVRTSTGHNPLQDELIYSYHSVTRNLNSVKRANDINNAFIWGYNNTYPIAKAVNAANNQIAFSSFENATDKGGWVYTHTPSTQKKTGDYSFQGTSISKSSLPSGIYNVGYWVKKSSTSNGTVTINGSAIAVSNSNWEYREFITGSAITSISISLSGVLLDELRLCPNDAQMTSYTYKPIIGMTSATDPAGITIYYEYDSYNRLHSIKDYQGNIVQQYEYHYQK